MSNTDSKLVGTVLVLMGLTISILEWVGLSTYTLIDHGVDPASNMNHVEQPHGVCKAYWGLQQNTLSGDRLRLPRNVHWWRWSRNETNLKP